MSRTVGSGDFPSTEWSLLHDSEAALPLIYERYRHPLVTFLKLRFRLQHDDAQEIFHAFVADKLVAQDLLATVDRARGRFRTFLTRVLGNFAIDWFRSEGAWTRRHLVAGEMTSNNNTPDAADAFDHTWAQTVLDQGHRQVRRLV